jgi:tRNA(Ile)-lysidine synthase
MAALGPFEATPHLVLAVSGGSDSMALVLLAEDWVRATGGRLTTLTVDHGLRADSASEVRCVGEWMRARGIKHEILQWKGDKPTSDIQRVAREARYGLLDNWCRDHGALHLLLGHTRDDQAETFLMRLQRGSGPDGLAGMSAQRELRHCRLLRPMLGMSRERLRDALHRESHSWLDDPSNLNLRFDRVRVRQEMREGWDSKALAENSRRYGLARTVLERDTDRLLAEICRFHAGGFCRIDRRGLSDAHEDLALRALARVLAAVGGLTHRPARGGVERLRAHILNKTRPAVTLGNCLVEARSGDIGVFRERRNLPAPVRPKPGLTLHWDRRFSVTFGNARAATDRGLHLRAFSPDDWRCVIAESPELRVSPPVAGAMPRSAFWGLPALADDSGVLAVPHLNYTRTPGGPGDTLAEVHFCPLHVASNAGFFVA